MGGPNLEVFKFGMYIMFPIGIMYYFGTNLDARFSTPDFWPKEHQTHRIPFEREEINEELERLKQRRLAARAQRLALQEQQGGRVEEDVESRVKGRDVLQAVEVVEPGKSGIKREGEILEGGKTEGKGKGLLGWFR